MCAILLRLYTSTERLKRVYKPRATFESMLLHISYGINYHLQLLSLKFLCKIRLNFKKFPFAIKIALFPKYLPANIIKYHPFFLPADWDGHGVLPWLQPRPLLHLHPGLGVHESQQLLGPLPPLTPSSCC